MFKHPRVQLGKTVHYLPILFIDQLSNRVKDLMVSNRIPLIIFTSFNSNLQCCFNYDFVIGCLL